MDYTPNILVVDDITSNLVVLTEIIRTAGYVARPVTSAQQALDAIKAYQPHLIILDISMPDMDGLEFCAMLKKIVKTRDIPVIFISAFNSKQDKIKGLKLGAVDYITKPYEIEEVTLRINTHLKIYKMQNELEIYNKKLYKIINDQIRTICDGQKNIIYSLNKVLELKEGIKHIDNVGNNSKLLAMSLQYIPEYKNEVTYNFVDLIELASTLRNIGKIAISDNILLKTTELNKEEIEIMKTHTEIGAKTLKEIYSYNERNEILKMAIDIAYSHHEKWDGTGYPNGLSGDAIPISARIVSIVDTYATLVGESSNTKAYTHEESMNIIYSEAGKSFDPDIVKVFRRIQENHFT